jgi:hypothetical protein
MPVTSVELRDYAERLARSSTDEVELRSSVSRAYYAAFHALLPLVSRLPKSAKSRSGALHITHEDFASRLSEWKTDAVHPALSRLKVTAGQVTRAMDANRAMRVAADYKLSTTIGPADARAQVERTRHILRAVNQFELAMAPPSASAEG